MYLFRTNDAQTDEFFDYFYWHYYTAEPETQIIRDNYFGCTYEDALNYNQDANVDDGSCEYDFADINGDGIINILDIVQLVNIVLD